MGGIHEDGTSLVSRMSSERTRGNGHQLKYRKFHLNLRKNSFTGGGQTLEQGAQIICGLSIPGDN